ncbi:methylated-DNA--[protein]-cysteine S-methyltransferase [Actinotalea sp. K2]|uniref:methylated-DNA--[protein]-cysteine S-methyltransferase n=1 Tax=Actinotalea sp. K2 TaxID=2939438 RepID=UPI002017D378|nr:methylated-DNA--[protein]-cysteine S-methyltransferase [Actinotalea sp. K2]MCL3859471.1 methylated-DNA--[protein]-cysteine S-methyltransferase [Actinotalea sp. K2]
MTTDTTTTPGLDRVVRACRAMIEAGGPVPAADLATLTGCGQRQLARLFATHAGTTPRAFGHAVRAGEVRRLLREHEQVTDAVFAAGFGSVRSFYETASPTLGMNPHQYATGAAGQTLRWTTVTTDLGPVLAVAGDLGLAAVRIGPDVDLLLEQVRREFPAAHLERDDTGLAELADGLRALARGDRPRTDLPVDLHGTAFQARVWDALRRIPAGQTRSYTEVAEAIGAPAAVRAVASACGANPVALVIPCHRVVRSDGSLGGYRWGLEVKRRLLETEQAEHATEDAVEQSMHLAEQPA